MKFNPVKTAFGRHETFALRYSWLSKGFQALTKTNGHKVFESENATVELGVGKNMVSAIRYWLRASQMIHPTVPEPTSLGMAILDVKEGYDPFLEDEATIWLIHWLIASNTELATSWFWFFNKFHRPEFTGQELQTALADFIKSELPKNKRPAANTIKNDALLLPRMYIQSKGSTRTPLEEALDSPLSLLCLVSQTATGRTYQSRSQARPGLPIGVLGFAVAQLMQVREINTIPIEELMYSRDDFSAPGSVFRLTETDLITKLEQLVQNYPDLFDIRDTAGIHQLYLVADEIDPMVFLEQHYSDAERGVAA